MKRLNKEGAPRLGELPEPRRWSAAELGDLPARAGAVVLDTRGERARFFARHLRHSIFAPFNRTFPTIAGSYVEPQQEIVLVAESRDVEPAVRCLVRIGLDRVIGWAPPEALDSVAAEALAATRTVDFVGGLDAELRRPSAAVLDVRAAEEHGAGHVPGAVQIAHTRLAAELERVPRGEPLLVYCESGARSASAASLLARHGYDVVAVEGSFFDWQRKA